MRNHQLTSMSASLLAVCCLAGVGSAGSWSEGHPRVVDRVAEEVHCLVFSPDHQTVAIAESENRLRLVDFKTGITSALLEGHTDTIAAVAFSPDGRRIATGGLDNTVRVWDAATHRQLSRADAPRCISLAFSPDGLRLVTGHLDRRLYGLMFWDLTAGGDLRSVKVVDTRLDRRRFRLPRLLRYSPDGRWVVFGNGGVYVLDVASTTIRSFTAPGISKSPISSYLFCNDKGWLVAASYHGQLTIWDVAEGRELFQIIPDPSYPWGSRIISMARVAGSNAILCGSEWNYVTVWDLNTRKVLPDSERLYYKADGPMRRSELILSDDGLGLAVSSYVSRVDLFDVRVPSPTTRDPAPAPQ